MSESVLAPCFYSVGELKLEGGGFCKPMKKINLLAFGAGILVTLLVQYFLNLNTASPPIPAVAVSETPVSTSEAVAPTVCEPAAPAEPKIIYKCNNDELDPSLQAPEYHSSLPEVLETNREGEVRVRWLEVAHARQYEVRMYDMKGQLAKTWKTSRTNLFLNQLPYPEDQEIATYQVRLVALGISDATGPESEPKKLQIKKLRSVMAPIIEAITVED